MSLQTALATLFQNRELLPYSAPPDDAPVNPTAAFEALSPPPVRPTITLPEGPDATLAGIGQGGYVTDAVNQTAQAALKVDDGGGGWGGQLAQALKLIVPVLAASAAYRQGALGSLTNGFLSAQEQQRRAADSEADNQYRRDVMQENRAARDEEQRRRVEADQARMAAAAEARENALTERINKALAPYRENPMYGEGIQPDIAASTQIVVPGVGSISLQEALERVGVAKTAEGRYIVSGKPMPKEPKKTTRGFTTTDEAGRIYRITEDSETGREIERRAIGQQPRTAKEPKAPTAPKAPTVKVTRDAVTEESEVTFVDPERGTTETFSEQDVAAMLDAAGYESDTATVRRTMRNPKAMQELTK